MPDEQNAIPDTGGGESPLSSIPQPRMAPSLHPTGHFFAFMYNAVSLCVPSAHTVSNLSSAMVRTRLL